MEAEESVTYAGKWRLSKVKDVDGILGFLFDDKGNVALIRKHSPAWQAGRLNGLGGRVEHGETPWKL